MLSSAPTAAEVDRSLSGGSRPLTVVTLGFIPLTDCAVLAVAREQGFAAAEGIDLRLVREVSWANIRDRVALGHLDGAQMLAGMPIAAALSTALDLDPVRKRMIAPFCLNRNGNGITVSVRLFADMMRHCSRGEGTCAAAMGEALRRVIEARRGTGAAPLTFGMVYPFSCHHYEVRYWMAACGIDPDADVRLVVIPPPMMVDSLRQGHVDGFCVGEPWNSLAVDAGLGRIVVNKAELWRDGVEKMLCVPERWALDHPATLAALIRALARAAAWAEAPANRARLVGLLATPCYLDLPAEIISRALAGEIVEEPGCPARRIEDFLVLHRHQANEPPLAQALWVYAQMVRWGQVPRRCGDEAAVGQIFRADIYHAALAGTAWPEVPLTCAARPAPLEPETFFDGRPFDPRAIDAYLNLGDIHLPRA